MVEFLRHPVTVIAVYEMIAGVATMLEAFWFVSVYNPDSADSWNAKYYRICWAWGILAGVTVFMSIMLILAVVAKSRIWATVWAWWELAYVIAYSVLSIILESMRWKSSLRGMQYFYMIFPRFFGLFAIVLVASYVMGPWKQEDRRRASSRNYERQTDDSPKITGVSSTGVI